MWRRRVKRTGALPIMARLALAMGQLAGSTASRLRDGERFGVSQGEEGLTEANLLRLRREVSALKAFTLTRAEERQSGADWEWWVETSRGNWFGALVQAKREHFKRDEPAYHLGYKAGAARVLQMNLLRDAARELGVAPLYVLYNGSRESFRYSSKYHPVPRDFDGVTVLGEPAARWLHGLEGEWVPAAAVSEFALPWSCIAACPHPDPVVEWLRGGGLVADDPSAHFGVALQALGFRHLFANYAESPRLAPRLLRSDNALPDYVQQVLADGADRDGSIFHPLKGEGRAPSRLLILPQGTPRATRRGSQPE